MVERYVILADSRNPYLFETPRQLTEIDGETLVGRTIRLLKQNGIEDIIVTSHDKRFDKLGAKRYEPKHNVYDPIKETGYWLNGFPVELLDEPVTFLFGDVYYSESAIRKIINTDTNSTLFFCTYNNKDTDYIKEHDEPLGYKVVDTELFKRKIEEVKKLKDEGKCCREPVVWELYRHINGQNVNIHQMIGEYVKINDISCDIDTKRDIDNLKLRTDRKFTKKLSIIIPYYKTYELTDKLLQELVRQKTDDVEIILIDDGCNEKRFDKYKEYIDIEHLKENVGGAAATNIGIKKAQGKYIGFIDSDDYIAKDYIKTLVEYINKRNEDVIFFAWQDTATNAVIRQPRNYAPWKAIYKKNILIYFPDGRTYSYDVPVWDYIQGRDYTYIDIDKVLYYYYSNREGNLTSRKAKLIKEGGE